MTTRAARRNRTVGAVIAMVLLVVTFYRADVSARTAERTKNEIVVAACKSAKQSRQVQLDAFDQSTESPLTVAQEKQREVLVQRLKTYRDSPLCALGGN